MSNRNLCVFSGYLGRDPEMRYTPSGQPVTNFSIGVSKKFNRSDGTKGETTVWPKLVAWGKLAEIINQYCAKGKFVIVECELTGAEAWKSGEEVKGAAVFRVKEIEMVGGGGERTERHQEAPGDGPEVPEDDFEF